MGVSVSDEHTWPGHRVEDTERRRHPACTCALWKKRNTDNLLSADAVNSNRLYLFILHRRVFWWPEITSYKQHFPQPSLVYGCGYEN